MNLLYDSLNILWCLVLLIDEKNNIICNHTQSTQADNQNTHLPDILPYSVVFILFKIYLFTFIRGVDFKLWNALNLCRFHFTSWFYCCNSRTVSEISVVPH